VDWIDGRDAGRPPSRPRLVGFGSVESAGGGPHPPGRRPSSVSWRKLHNEVATLVSSAEERLRWLEKDLEAVSERLPRAVTVDVSQN
jgi:hypothetical protein